MKGQISEGLKRDRAKMVRRRDEMMREEEDLLAETCVMHIHFMVKHPIT